MNAPWPIPLHPTAPAPCNPFLQKPAQIVEKEPRVPKEVAKAVCAAAMLGAAVSALQQPGVLTSEPVVEQAKAVQEAFRAASRSSLPKGLPPTMRRRIMNQADEVTRIAARIMPDELWHSPFVVARVMAAHYFVHHQVVHVPALKQKYEWRELERCTYAFLDMLMPDLEEEEERMFALTEEMFLEFKGKEDKKRRAV
jgi:hypothetical protein